LANFWVRIGNKRYFGGSEPISIAYCGRDIMFVQETAKELNQSSKDIIHTVDQNGNPFEYHLKDLYPNEESYQYITRQSKIFEELAPELIAKYGGNYIVFEDGEVIDFDEDEDVLLDRIWDTDFIKKRMGIDGHGIYCHLVPQQQ
jgi:hypothetical protein